MQLFGKLASGLTAAADDTKLRLYERENLLLFPKSLASYWKPVEFDAKR